MIKLTLDTNCIIDLEENRPDTVFIRQIVEAWRDGRIELAVVAISASENQYGGKINETYERFLDKLAAVGLAGVAELLPLAYWDVAYWDRALWADEKNQLEIKIRNLLFPEMQSEAPSTEKELRKWRNRLCDVLVAWSHVHHGWDVLITNDMNFHKKKDGLANLGVNVMSPEEAVEFVQERMRVRVE